MTKLIAFNPGKLGGPTSRRAIALDNISRFRATACRVLRGGPKAEERAANARSVARAVLRQLKQEAVDARLAREALTADL